MGVSRYIARRYQRSRRRSRALNRAAVIAIGGITVGVFVLNVVLAVMNGFHEQLQKSFVDTMPMISVTSGAADGFGDLDRTLETIAGTSGVTGVSPQIRQEVVVSKRRLFGNPISRGAISWGIDPERVDSVMPFSSQLQPDPAVAAELAPAAGEAPRVVLGSELATSLWAALGDTVLLTAPRGEMGLGEIEAETRRFVVAGYLESGMYEFDSRFLYLHLDTAREFFGYGDQGAGIVGVRVEDMFAADVVADSLEAQLGDSYRAIDWKALNSSIFDWVKYEKAMMFVLISLIVLVAAFNIVGILTMMVGERGREVGILLAMGASRRQLQWIFVFNGAWYGFLGTALGSLLGWLGCLFLIHVGVPIPGDLYFVDSLPCIPMWQDFLLVAGATMGLTLLATLLPSREASRLDPMAIIRYT
jgi:lipoprotein-releasing system permease protein